MAEIHELTSYSGTPSTGTYLVVDNGTTTTKIDYNALAKAILENYASSTLAGSAQSVQSALNALNSKIGRFTSFPTISIPSGGANTYTLSSGGAYILITYKLSTAASTFDSVYIITRSGTTMHYTPILNNTNVSITLSSDGTVTIANSAGVVYTAALFLLV